MENMEIALNRSIRLLFKIFKNKKSLRSYIVHIMWIEKSSTRRKKLDKDIKMSVFKESFIT